MTNNTRALALYSREDSEKIPEGLELKLFREGLELTLKDNSTDRDENTGLYHISTQPPRRVVGTVDVFTGDSEIVTYTSFKTRTDVSPTTLLKNWTEATSPLVGVLIDNSLDEELLSLYVFDQTGESFGTRRGGRGLDFFTPRDAARYATCMERFVRFEHGDIYHGVLERFLQRLS